MNLTILLHEIDDTNFHLRQEEWLDYGDCPSGIICKFCKEEIYIRKDAEKLEPRLWQFLMHRQCYLAWKVYPDLRVLGVNSATKL